MNPYEKYLRAIKEEIANDPEGLGYSGKTFDEQMVLMNEPYSILVPQVQTARIAQVINQIAFAPNIASLEDVKNAQGEITTEKILSTGSEINAKLGS